MVYSQLYCLIFYQLFLCGLHIGSVPNDDNIFLIAIIIYYTKVKMYLHIVTCFGLNAGLRSTAENSLFCDSQTRVSSIFLIIIVICCDDFWVGFTDTLNYIELF